MTESIEPGPGVNADGLDDQCVALPCADGVSRPTRIRIFRETAAVRVDLTGRIAGARDHDDFAGCLDHLERQHQHAAGKARRQTVRGLKLLAGLSLPKDGDGLRTHRLLLGFQTPKHIENVLRDIGDIDLQLRKPGTQDPGEFVDGRAFCLPDAGHIGLAVEPWGWRRQVRSAVCGAGNLGVAMIQPLRLDTHRSSSQQQSERERASQH